MNRYPKAIGPYSTYRTCGDLIFVSGQLPIESKNSEIVEGIGAQTRKSLQNIGAILDELGLNFKHIVKATVFLKNIDDFSAMNEVYEDFLEDPYPARSAFAVKNLPKDALVEIEVIACKRLS